MHDTPSTQKSDTSTPTTQPKPRGSWAFRALGWSLFTVTSTALVSVALLLVPATERVILKKGLALAGVNVKTLSGSLWNQTLDEVTLNDENAPNVLSLNAKRLHWNLVPESLFARDVRIVALEVEGLHVKVPESKEKTTSNTPFAFEPLPFGVTLENVRVLDLKVETPGVNIALEKAALKAQLTRDWHIALHSDDDALQPTVMESVVTHEKGTPILSGLTVTINDGATPKPETEPVKSDSAPRFALPKNEEVVAAWRDINQALKTPLPLTFDVGPVSLTKLALHNAGTKQTVTIESILLSLKTDKKRNVQFQANVEDRGGRLTASAVLQNEKKTTTLKDPRLTLILLASDDDLAIPGYEDKPFPLNVQSTTYVSDDAIETHTSVAGPFTFGMKGTLSKLNTRPTAEIGVTALTMPSTPLLGDILTTNLSTQLTGDLVDGLRLKGSALNTWRQAFYGTSRDMPMEWDVTLKEKALHLETLHVVATSGPELTGEMRLTGDVKESPTGDVNATGTIKLTHANLRPLLANLLPAELRDRPSRLSGEMGIGVTLSDKEKTLTLDKTHFNGELLGLSLKADVEKSVVTAKKTTKATTDDVIELSAPNVSLNWGAASLRAQGTLTNFTDSNPLAAHANLKTTLKVEDLTDFAGLTLGTVLPEKGKAQVALTLNGPLSALTGRLDAALSDTLVRLTKATPDEAPDTLRVKSVVMGGDITPFTGAVRLPNTLKIQENPVLSSLLRESVDLTLTGTEVTFNDVTVKNLTGALLLSPNHQSLTLESRGHVAGDVAKSLSQMLVKLDDKVDNDNEVAESLPWRVKTALSGDTLKEKGVIGAWTLQNTAVTLDHLTITQKDATRVLLTETGNVTTTDLSLTVGPHPKGRVDLLASTVNLAHQGQWGSLGQVKTALHTEGFSVGLANPWLPNRLKASGLVDAVINVSHEVPKTPEPMLNGWSSDFSLTWLKGMVTPSRASRLAPWTIKTAEVKGSLSHEKLSATTTLAIDTDVLPVAGFDVAKNHMKPTTSSMTLKSDIAIDEPLGKKTLTGTIDLQGLNPGLANPLLQGEGRLEGLVDAKLRLAGSLDHPEIYGPVALTNATAKVAAAEIEMTPSSMTWNFLGERAEMTGNLKTETGDLTLTGKADWSKVTPETPKPNANVFEVRAQGKDLTTTMPLYGSVTVSPDMMVRFNPATGLTVVGLVDVPKAKITVHTLPETSVQPSSDLVILKPDLTPVEPKEAPFPIVLYTILRLGDDVNVNVFDLKAQLAGKLVLSQNQAGLAANGTISLTKGNFRAYGQDLIIKEGQVTFAGPLDTPYLSVKAIRNPENTEDDVVAGLSITGNAQAPKVKVFSTPALPQAQALSYLLRGEAIGGENSNNAMITSALIGMGLSQTGQVVTKIGEAIGLNDLNVDTKGSGDNTAFVVSATVLPGLQVSYGVGLFDTLMTLTLRYRVMKNLYVEAISGAAQSLDMLYRIRW